jgi:hypothetical protein
MMPQQATSISVSDDGKKTHALVDLLPRRYRALVIAMEEAACTEKKGDRVDLHLKSPIVHQNPPIHDIDLH